MPKGHESDARVMRELPLLTCVAATLTRASTKVAALPHALQLVSALLDYSVRAYWTIPRACQRHQHGSLALLNRLQAREPQDIDRHYKAHLFSSALENTAQRVYTDDEDNEYVKQHELRVVQWLHAYLPSGNASRGMEAAARSGKLHILEWLGAHHERVTWSPRFVEVAAEEGHLPVLQWLAHGGRIRTPDWGQLVSVAMSYCHLDVITWIHSHVVETIPVLREGNGDMQPSNATATAAAQNHQSSMVQDLQERGYQVTLAVHEILPNGSPEKLQWLHDHSFPISICDGATLDIPAAAGNLRILQWLHDHGVTRCTMNAVDSACRAGNLEVVQWLHVNRSEGCTQAAMDNAAAEGHFDIVKWLHDHRTEGCTTKALNGAAAGGHLELVRWLHANREEGCTTSAMDVAAMNGHLEVVQWLHDNRSEGCTMQAMDAAARNGHLRVVQWLHENRREGCSLHAMDYAASHRHFEVLEWLHANRSEGCTTDAMDCACSNGDLKMVEWLHLNRSEGCTENAMDWAAKNGHLHVVKWLHVNRSEGATTNAMDRAAENSHLDVVQWLHENRNEGCTMYAMDNAAYNEHLSVVQWLHEHRTEGCTPGAMNRAMMTGNFEIVLFLHANRSEGCTEAINFSDCLLQHLEMLAWVCEHYRDKLFTDTMFWRVDMKHHPYLEAVLKELWLVPSRQR